MTKKRKNPSKKRIRSLFLIIMTFVVWAGLTVYNQFFDIKEIKGRVTDLEQKESLVLSKQEELQNKVLLLEDDDYISEMARKFYFLSKPGEFIFITPEE